MANVFIRTILLYLLIVVLMRITGKRQIGQLELTELVTAFMVSELASYPISNNSIPLLYGVLPAISLICLEVFLSFISVKSKKFRTMIAGSALMLVRAGTIDQEQMKKARITMEGLLGAARNCGVFCVSDISYAFLESSGTISVLPKASKVPVSAEDMGKNVPEPGAEHPLIIDGNLCRDQMKQLNISENRIRIELEKLGYEDLSEVFYLGINDLKEVYAVKKQKKPNQGN